MFRPHPQHRGAPARGFTLIELMITVAILGILGAVAYPAYGHYIVDSNRAAAQAHLMELAQAQAEYYADARAYADSVTGLGMETPAAVSSKYDIGIELTEGRPAGFVITASPIEGGTQDGDGDLSIDNAGTRTPAEKW